LRKAPFPSGFYQVPVWLLSSDCDRLVRSEQYFAAFQINQRQTNRAGICFGASGARVVIPGLEGSAI
jgi:hypothetical protein